MRNLDSWPGRSWMGRLGSEGWRLRRSWPRRRDHLLLELVDPSGRRTAGQWFADPERAATIASATPGAHQAGSVVVQPAGADRRLPALARLLDQHDAHPELVSHRPERRAVVSCGSHYLKVVRRSAFQQTVDKARLAETLQLGAPAVLSTDHTTATIGFETLPGRPLTEILAGDHAAQACAAVGARLAGLHRLTPAAAAGWDLTRHGPQEEIAVLRRWTGFAADYGLDGDYGLHSDGLHRDAGALPMLPSRTDLRLIHRDFHDGQVVMDDGRLGILDFDLLAIGDPALDLANFLAHLELRAEQGILADPSAAITATLEAYWPDSAVRAALPGYLMSSRMRLRAVYAFRDPGLRS